MKENSKEEDIKIIENLKEAINSGLCYFGSVTMYDCGYQDALEHILSDYKRVLKTNEVLLKENEELKIKNNAIKRESEAYAEHMIRLDNELNLEKEKSKYEWIRQNCLPQELVNKLYIPIQKIKDKIEGIQEEGYWLFTTDRDSDKCVEVLQELLEGRK